jgi:hypothetical protein
MHVKHVKLHLLWFSSQVCGAVELAPSMLKLSTWMERSSRVLP